MRALSCRAEAVQVDLQSGLGETGMGGRQLPPHPSKADVCLPRTCSVSLPPIVPSDRILTLPLWLKHVLMSEKDDTKTPQEKPRYNYRDMILVPTRHMPQFHPSPNRRLVRAHGVTQPLDAKPTSTSSGSSTRRAHDTEGLQALGSLSNSRHSARSFGFVRAPEAEHEQYPSCHLILWSRCTQRLPRFL
jgi:hypothetical protein